MRSIISFFMKCVTSGYGSMSSFSVVKGVEVGVDTTSCVAVFSSDECVKTVVIGVGLIGNLSCFDMFLTFHHCD